MAPQEDIFKTLRGNDIDEAELHEIVLQHFHSAIELSPAELIFPRPDDPQNYAVKFVYKKQRLTQILAGPALKPEDINTLQGVVEAELKTPAPVKVGAEVLFADMPLDGSFRYRNLFQILPLPPDAPRPNKFGFDHPFLVQFSFRPSTLTMLRFSRRIAQAHKLQLLLAGILEGRIRGLGVYLQHYWVVPSNQPPEQLTSAYYQQMYGFPGTLAQLAESAEGEAGNLAKILHSATQL